MSSNFSRDGALALVVGVVLAVLVAWAVSRVPAEPVVIDYPSMAEACEP